MTPEDARPPAVANEEADERARAFVEAFAEGWRAPTSADALADHFDPWLHSDYRFVQPLIRGAGTGPVEFRETFLRPFFSVCSEVHGLVESWACCEDTVFIALRIEARVGRHPVTLHVCDHVQLVEGRAYKRVTYADMSPLVAAVLRIPALWWPVVRWKITDLRASRRSHHP